jgi:hypothetical protein
VKTTWIVRWRGLDEACTSPQEAMDRLDHLDARGIEAELHEVVDGWRRKVGGSGHRAAGPARGPAHGGRLAS